MSGYILEIENITKTFPGVRALDDVSIRIQQGTIHALVGENGAGKSTLMKILYGNIKPDSGKIMINGENVQISSPVKAEELGLSIIFQELNLIPELSVGENIFIGHLNAFRKRRGIDWKELHTQAARELERVGAKIDTRKLASELSMAERQMVEIVKALSHQSKLLMMDEPSATLTTKELSVLFKIIRDLKKNGVTIIYISHRLEEIFNLCDTVTVIRDGRVVKTLPVADVTKDMLIQYMVGRELSQTFPKIAHHPEEEVLRVEGLTRKGVVEDINLSLRKGEVLGIAGLVGSGRTEVFRMIFGVDYMDSGKIFVHGKEVRIKSPQDAIQNGVVYLPEERKKDGLILPFTVGMNISMTNLTSISGKFFLSKRKEKRLIAEQIEKLSIKTPSYKQKVSNLSGGNQQKIVVAKWLNTKADIFIFDEPTRGIDIGTKHEIYLIINEIIKQGKSVILISSELPEVLALSNRVLVMHDGRITGELTGKEINAENVMHCAVQEESR